MSKVKHLKQAKKRPIASVIEVLEDMLEKAKAGDVYSLVILAENRDGNIDYSRSIDTRNNLRLVGALEMFKLSILNDFISDVPGDS